MSKTFSQMNYRQCKSSVKIITMIITSNDSLWTSVTSHQAQAHPPTTVFLLVDPQQPPERNNLEKSFFLLLIDASIFRLSERGGQTITRCASARGEYTLPNKRPKDYIQSVWLARLLQRRLSNCMKGVFIFYWWIAQKNVWCTWRAGCQRAMLPVTDYSFQDSQEHSASTWSSLNKSWPIPQKYVYLVVFDTKLFVTIYQVPKSKRVWLWLNNCQFVKFPNLPLQLKLNLLTWCQKGSLAPVNAAPGNY